MVIGQDKLYKSQGMWWSVKNYHDINPSHVDGPYCSNCYTDLEYPEQAHTSGFVDDDWKGGLICPSCKKEHPMTDSLWEMKTNVARQYTAFKRSTIPKESLDETPTAVKVRDQDEKYFIAAKIGEKDGKRVGVVYFGDKNKDQSKQDYSQIFIDLDDEQVRFDKSNKFPKGIITKMKVEFPNSTHEEVYTKTEKLKQKSISNLSKSKKA
jgi:hypothetical protein